MRLRASLVAEVPQSAAASSPARPSGGALVEAAEQVVELLTEPAEFIAVQY